MNCDGTTGIDACTDDCGRATGGASNCGDILIGTGACTGSCSRCSGIGSGATLLEGTIGPTNCFLTGDCGPHSIDSTGGSGGSTMIVGRINCRLLGSVCRWRCGGCASGDITLYGSTFLALVYSDVFSPGIGFLKTVICTPTGSQ